MDEHHPAWYRELYTIFYKTYDKRGYSSHSTRFFDLYTYQNAKITHSVDNAVDNVDNLLWISHTVFVNKGYARLPFTHGKLAFRHVFMQDALQNRLGWYVSYKPHYFETMGLHPEREALARKIAARAFAVTTGNFPGSWLYYR